MLKIFTHKTITASMFLVLAQVMVGINIVSAKYLLATVPMLFILAVRFSLAACLLFALHCLTERHPDCIRRYTHKLVKRDWLFIIAQALTAGVLFNLLMIYGLQYTSANVAGIITSTLPALIAVICWLALKEPLTRKKALCVALATVGLVVISLDKFRMNSDHGSLLGICIILLSMLPEATYYVLTKMYVNVLPIFLISGIISAINVVIVVPLMFLYGSWGGLHLSAMDWMGLMIIGTTSGLFFVFWYLGASKVDATLASLSTAIMPVATVTIAWLALGEMITPWQFVGMGLVIASIVAYAQGVGRQG